MEELRGLNWGRVGVHGIAWHLLSIVTKHTVYLFCTQLSSQVVHSQSGIVSLISSLPPSLSSLFKLKISIIFDTNSHDVQAGLEWTDLELQAEDDLELLIALPLPP